MKSVATTPKVISIGRLGVSRGNIDLPLRGGSQSRRTAKISSPFSDRNISNACFARRDYKFDRFIGGHHSDAFLQWRGVFDLLIWTIYGEVLGAEFCFVAGIKK